MRCALYRFSILTGTSATSNKFIIITYEKVKKQKIVVCLINPVKKKIFVFSTRAHQPRKGLYKILALTDTETDRRELKRVQNIHAEVFAYHFNVETQAKNIENRFK